ncbi:hypothetical protein PF004_g9543 [Phytophthora fragariae]|uniref:Uncharacterized protein n=1 Tax=Phytophthora fragariae TaxID=53985 RepID=A0A6G0P3V2_9STRA|nr:hypothetical protein PF004_g9543 [Phytophthora fragariae]
MQHIDNDRIHFCAAAVCEFKQVHRVRYFSDIVKGSVQLEEASSDRVVVRLPPILKRNNAGEPSGRHPRLESCCRMTNARGRRIVTAWSLL